MKEVEAVNGPPSQTHPAISLHFKHTTDSPPTHLELEHGILGCALNQGIIA
jgi:hypothetical protein